MPELFPRRAFELVTPPDATGEPRLWIERFCLWTDRDQPTREIGFKPGLNIIWSPDASEGDKAIGHGAGKTTLCRLLRFCLGENTFAPKEQQDLIASTFPTGKVGIEVHLEGERWAIVRSFRRYFRDIVLRDGTLEQALAAAERPDSMATFVSAVQASFFAGVHDLFPRKVGEDEVWGAALAWLSRDQECRFDGVLDWRHAQTNSESPVRDLKLEERSQVIRALLGCVSKDEAALDDPNVVAGPSAAELEADKLLWAIARLQRSLADKLGGDTALGIGNLDVELLEQRVREKFPELPPLQLTALRRARQNAFAALQRATAKVRTLENDRNTHVLEYTGSIELLTKKRGIVEHYADDVTLASNPACPVCSIPLDRIYEEGCPCSTLDTDLDAVRERHEQAATELGALEIEVSGSRRILDELETSVARARSEEETAVQAFKAAEAEEEKTLNSTSEGERLFDQVHSLKSLIKDHETEESRVAEEAKRSADRAQVIRGLRASSRIAIQQISTRFDEVVRELFPDKVSGTVSLDGPVLELNVGPGKRSTAAIDSWKAVAFDLSALTLACEGTATLPAWLLHDSPREADLGESIYERLFSFVRLLEKMSQFQYIVTTTTPPPANVRNDSYVRARLKGAPAAERLFGCDL